MKRTLSLLLTLLMMAGLIAIAPVTAGAVVIGVNDADGLALALASAADGDTIKLTADIDYEDAIAFNGKSITFDLNGKILNATDGVHVGDGDLLLAKPIVGALNVSRSDGDAGTTVEALRGKVEVSSVTDSVYSSWPLCADGGEIMVYGDVAYTGTPGGTCTGAVVFNNGKITIDGVFTVPAGAKYIAVEYVDKAPEDFETPSTKTGYIEYNATDGTDTSTVWVKCSDHEWGAGWDKDAAGHKHSGVCALCGAADTAAVHTYGAWVVTLEPTAEDVGSRSRTCSVCGYVDTEAIPALGYEYVGGPFGFFKTKYVATQENWIKFYVFFGWIWMWFILPAA